MYLVLAEHYEHNSPLSQPPPMNSRLSVKTKRVAKRGRTLNDILMVNR